MYKLSFFAAIFQAIQPQIPRLVTMGAFCIAQFKLTTELNDIDDRYGMPDDETSNKL